MLPLTEDVEKFCSYLVACNEALNEQLEEQEPLTKEQYRDLVVSNPRCCLPVQQTASLEGRNPPKDFDAQPKDNSREEVFASLSTTELAINRLKVIEVRGKRGRRVPILRNDRVYRNMKTLQDYNEKGATDMSSRDGVKMLRHHISLLVKYESVRNLRSAQRDL